MWFLVVAWGCGGSKGVPEAVAPQVPVAPQEAPATAPEGRCEQAFDHMTKVSEDELQTLPPDARKIAEDAQQRLAAGEPERRRNFVAKCEAGQIDVDCIMAAKDTMAYIACLRG